MNANGRGEGRWEELKPENLQWADSVYACQVTGKHSSHAFIKNSKLYGEGGSPGRIHIFALRHTKADAVYQRAGNIGAVQYQPDHKNQQTSVISIQSKTIKPEMYCRLLNEAFGL